MDEMGKVDESWCFGRDMGGLGCIEDRLTRAKK